MKVSKLSSAFVAGSIKTYPVRTINVSDIDRFFDTAIVDAKMLAVNNGGKIAIQRTETTLYIDYTFVPNCNKVDTFYSLVIN